MHAHSYLRSALSILDQYKGNIPFAPWLKDYFRQNKKFGSRDRKWISHLCYSFFRTGRAFQGSTMEEKTIIGLFLSLSNNELLDHLDPELNTKADLPLREKLKNLPSPDHHPVSGLEPELSSQIDKEAFSLSHYIQPDLFIRIRPGYHADVKRKLDLAGIPWKERDVDCLSLPVGTKLDNLFVTDREVVIQDLNSQKVLDTFLNQYQIPNTQFPILNPEFTAWDCCAASGGKSLLLADKCSNVQLTVSDIRESIIRNLHQRFIDAGISNYETAVLDVSAVDFQFDRQFDLVICDAPCTGSGTWSRTPEQLFFFEKRAIQKYSELQQSIALNAARSVKPGGYLCYITCSVFEKENEEVVEYIKDKAQLRLIASTYHVGYDKKADTLFSALFKRA